MPIRLVKAAKASPHAKFYNLSTAYRQGSVGDSEALLGMVALAAGLSGVTQN